MINKENFKCARCGDCCKFTVILDKKDLERIKTNLKNYEKYINLESDPPTIKLKDNQCIFLERNNKDQTKCKIYEFRPKICIMYPFFNKTLTINTCKPSQNQFLNRYNHLNLSKNL